MNGVNALLHGDMIDGKHDDAFSTKTVIAATIRVSYASGPVLECALTSPFEVDRTERPKNFAF